MVHRASICKISVKNILGSVAECYWEKVYVERDFLVARLLVALHQLGHLAIAQVHASIEQMWKVVELHLVSQIASKTVSMHS